MDHIRAPLRDIAVNSPSLKRQKLNSSTALDVKQGFNENVSHQEPQDREAQFELLRLQRQQQQQEREKQEQEKKEQKRIAEWYEQQYPGRYLNKEEFSAEEKYALQQHQLTMFKLHQELREQQQREQQHSQHQQQQQQDSQSIPLPEWQRKWRKIMRESVIYFDSNDLSVSEGIKKREKEKAIKMFTQVGASIQPFFDHRVTILVSNRSKSELPKNIQTQQQSINAPHPLKFWNYEKVFRFLKHLGEVPSPEKQQQHHQAKHLSTLLQDEKLHGTNDRDPNAKRDDFNYFKHPYFYVYDLRQVTKPVALREWKVKETSSDKKPWPHLYDSTYGHSLFQPDPSNIHDPRKRERRRLRDEQNKAYRDKLKAIYSANPPESEYSLSDSEDSQLFEDTTYLDDQENNEDGDTMAQMPPPQSHMNTHSAAFPATLNRSNSALPFNKFIESNKRDNFEIEASGYTGSGNTGANKSNEFSKNGLVAATSTIHSKEVNSLHRRLIEKKSKMTPHEQLQLYNNKTKVAGYCENCRIHFEDFDEHCVSASHRAFALDDSNFQDIDLLIFRLLANIRNNKT